MYCAGQQSEGLAFSTGSGTSARIHRSGSEIHRLKSTGVVALHVVPPKRLNGWSHSARRFPVQLININATCLKSIPVADE
jgi:hypothetical protein